MIIKRIGVLVYLDLIFADIFSFFQYLIPLEENLSVVSFNVGQLTSEVPKANGHERNTSVKGMLYLLRERLHIFF